MSVELGTIKLVNDRGFGFIRPALTGAADVFFHASNCMNFELFEAGDSVQFERGISDRHGKPCAVRVKVIGTPAEAEAVVRKAS